MPAPAISALVLSVLLALPLFGSSYGVNDLGDAADASSGDGICATAGAVCTLRAAIQEANANVDEDHITFSVVGTIAPAPGSPLPAIATRVVIDATSAPGYAGTPVVILQGTVTGLVFAYGSSGSQLAGLKIHDCSSAAVSIATSNITVRRNHIGPINGGIGNAIGIDLGAASCTIGGSSDGEGNVISGNSYSGMSVRGDGNTIVGNLIGTDASGAFALPNLVGIEVAFASGVTIGSAGAGMNVISGNTTYGIVAYRATNLLITNNRIGTDVTGMIDIGNQEVGIGTTQGFHHDISSNLISGNSRWGVGINTPDTRIYGNTIGRNAANTGPLPNDWGGITVSGTNCVIGTPELGGNVIASNKKEAGVVITYSAAKVTITANSIFANEAGSFEAGLGIELLDDSGYGPDTNDPMDADTGPNGMQNFPVIASSVTTPVTSWTAGSLNSTPATPFALHFYSNTVADPTGFGEGETYLGTTNVMTDAAGNASFNWNGPALTPGRLITATATGPSGTSEFSAAEGVVAASADLSIDKSGTYDVGGQEITFLLTVANAGPDAATNVSVTDPLPAGTSLVSATPSSGTCSGTATVDCTFPLIAAGGSASVSIVVTANGGSVTNTATVSAPEIDPNAVNNADATTVPAAASPAGIPTASAWGLIALMAMLAAIAIGRMRL